jgi:hypothetical protein
VALQLLSHNEIDRRLLLVRVKEIQEAINEMIPEKLADITVDWLNDALHENGFLENNRIAILTQEPVGAGAGNLSQMAKLAVSFDRDDANLPTTMVAKIPTLYESAREIGRQLNAYERETRFYIDVASHIPMRTPQLIYGAADSENERYVLLLEDCSRCAVIDQVKGLDLELSQLIAIKLADFHSAYWNSDDISRFAWLPRPRGSQMQATVDVLRTSVDACAKSDKFKQMLPEGGWEVCLKVYDRAPLMVQSVSDENLTIIHSDFRADNMFLDYDTPDDPLVVFDWQMVQVSRGPFDLAYLLGASIEIDLRRQIEKDIVRLYYNRLLEKGVSGYDFDECWSDYLKGWLMYTYILTMAFASLDMSNPRAAELLRRAEDRWFTAILDNDATRVLP